jgi:hypothetical protein
MNAVDNDYTQQVRSNDAADVALPEEGGMKEMERKRNGDSPLSLN